MMLLPKSPLVSIGLPTYNRPKGLKRVLTCLVNQTYVNIEIILSNNCSTDPETEKTIDEYLFDKRIKYFKQSINIGPLGNQNFILEKSTGDFFMRMADDDWIDTNYIESCLNFLLQNPEYSSAYGMTKIYNSDGGFEKFDANVDFIQNNSEERLKVYFKNVIHNGTYYALIRKDLMQYAVANRRLADDWLIIGGIIFNGKMKLIAETNIHMSLGGVSKSLDNIVAALKLSRFNKKFPSFSIAFNAFNDVLYRSKAYGKLNFFKRLSLAFSVYKVICKKLSVSFTSTIKQAMYKLLLFLRLHKPIKKMLQVMHLKK